MKKRATSRDVAALAGVSQTTVSYVLNNNPNQSISEETKQRILAAARQLNYIPNNIARALKGVRMNCIAVVLNNYLATPRFILTLQGIRDVLDVNGISLLLCNGAIQDNGNPDYLNYYLQQQVDGIVYIASDREEPSGKLSETIHRYHMPVSAIDCLKDDPEVSSICFDYYSGAYEAALYHLIRGRRQIAFIHSDLVAAQEEERKAGICDAVATISGASLSMYSINYSKYTDYSQILSAPPDCAYICSWGTMATPAALLLLQHQRHLPLVSLTQTNQTSLDELLGYVAYSYLPSYEAGKKSAEYLLAQIDDADFVQKIILKPSMELPN